MLSWPPTVKIYLGADPTDMRKGFDSLAHLVESDILHRLPSHHADQLDELLPDVWFASHPSARRKKAA